MYTFAKEYQKIHLLLIQMLVKERGIHVNRIYSLFQQMKTDDFKELFQSVLDKKDYDLLKQFRYYLNLFSHKDCVKNLISALDLEINLVEQLIEFTYVNALMQELSLFDEMSLLIRLFDQFTLLSLLLNSKRIKNDKLLSYFILSRLDKKHVDIYFNQKEELYPFLSGLKAADKNFLEEMLSNNDNLIGYIEMIFQMHNDPFVETLKSYYTHNTNNGLHMKISGYIRSNFDLEQERTLPFGERDPMRYAYIISQLEDSHNSNDLLDKLFENRVLIEPLEKNLITQITTNPIFKNILINYQSYNFDKVGTHSAVLF